MFLRGDINDTMRHIMYAPRDAGLGLVVFM